ncbi:MAG: hypothetical protein ONB05_04580 [candidate division KSB1 bacterium]|nr:hypothetical protein [candidate division KSB1 bacterium]
MKEFLKSLPLLLLLSTNSLGQNGSELTDFQGGQYTFKLSLSNNLFLGVGSRVGGLGGDYGGLLPTSETLLWNPANLAFIKKSQWTFDVNPPLMFNPTSLVDIDGEVRSAVDDNIADMKGENFSMKDEDYPELALSLGEKGNFGTGSFAWRNGEFTIAGALFQPFHLTLDLVGTGFEARMETVDEEDPALSVTFFSSLDLSLSTRIKIQGWSLGAGRMITPRWAAGLSLERLSGLAEVNAQFQVEGIMVTAGNERAFNDPNDPWENNLHSSVKGGYQGSSTTYKLGTTYKLNENWGLGTVLSLAQPLTMKGELKIIQRTLPGLNLQAEGDEDILDATKIDLDEPTKTIQQHNPTSELLILNLPSSLGIGISGQIGFLGVSLNYNRYFGECSYQYDVMRNGEEIKYSQGIKLSNEFRLGLELTKYFRLGCGMTMGTLVDKNQEPSKPQGIIVPTFSLGTGFKLNRNLTTDLLLLAIPAGVGKISISYEL